MAEVDLYGGDAQRIRDAYRTSLRRDASDDELGGWLGGSYGGGGVDDWIRQISQSHEAQQYQQPQTVGPQPNESRPQQPTDTGGLSGPTSPPPTSGPPAPQWWDQSQIDQWYQQYLGRPPGADAAVHAGNPYGIGGVHDAIRQSEEALAYTNRPQPTAAPAAPTTPGLPQGGIQAYVNSLLQGKPSTPETLASLEAQLAQYGIKLQKDSAGNVRGRIYLPDGRAVDVISQWGQPWTWIDRGMGGPTSGGSGSSGYGSGGFGGGNFGGMSPTFNDQWTKQLEQLLSSRIGALSQPVFDPNRAMYEQALKDRATQLGAAEQPYTQLLDYLQKRFTDLQGPGYTGAENEVIRTGALDPIEADRSAAKKRVIERLAARNIGPDSGVYQDALLQVDKAFDGMRGTTQTALTTNDLNRREDRQQRATSIGAQLVDIPEGRKREQLDVFSALELLSKAARGEEDARSREAISYGGALSDLGPQRLQLAMQAAGMGGSPDSMMDSLLRVAGLNQNASFLANQNSTSKWSGLGSILAILSNMGRR